jgi:hypothetical protein
VAELLDEDSYSLTQDPFYFALICHARQRICTRVYFLGLVFTFQSMTHKTNDWAANHGPAWPATSASGLPQKLDMYRPPITLAE